MRNKRFVGEDGQRDIRMKASRTQSAWAEPPCGLPARCQVGVAVLLFMFISPVYVPDFICRDDLGNYMGPNLPSWGLKGDGEPLLGPGPGLRDKG